VLKVPLHPNQSVGQLVSHQIKLIESYQAKSDQIKSMPIIWSSTLSEKWSVFLLSFIWKHILMD